MSRLASALTNYQTNNGGKLPAQDVTYSRWTAGSYSAFEVASSTCDKSIPYKFVKEYLNEPNPTDNSFKDPNGSYYNMMFLKDVNQENSGASATATGSYMTIIYNSKCDGEKAVAANGSSNYTTHYKLEGAGTACLDNQ